MARPTEIDGKTTMEMISTFSSAEVAEATVEAIKPIGGFTTWERLAEYLAERVLPV